MKKLVYSLALGLALSASPALTQAQAQAQVQISDNELIEQLQRIFTERPDLVLTVLRNNSEAILDIAQEGSTKKRKRALEAQWREDMKEPKNINIEGRPIWGAKDAPITIVEFSDFTCPYCAQAAATIGQIKKAYGDKVRLVFKHTPLSASPTAIIASEYVIAAGLQSEEKSYALYEALFTHRTELLERGEAFIKEQAKEIGFDMQKLVKQAQSMDVKKILEQDLKDGRDLGVEGTPYFFINDIVVRGALSGELIKAAIDLALKEKKKK